MKTRLVTYVDQSYTVSATADGRVSVVWRGIDENGNSFVGAPKIMDRFELDGERVTYVNPETDPETREFVRAWMHDSAKVAT